MANKTAKIYIVKRPTQEITDDKEGKVVDRIDYGYTRGKTYVVTAEEAKRCKDAGFAIDYNEEIHPDAKPQNADYFLTKAERQEQESRMAAARVAANEILNAGKSKAGSK